MVEVGNGAAPNGNGLDDKQFYALERARIDASCRLPVIVWFCCGVFWLLIGSTLALIASIKLHSPEWLFPDVNWLTFGRVRAAHLSSVNMGWSFCMAIGVALWQMCRLSRCELISSQMACICGGGLEFRRGTWRRGHFVRLRAKRRMARHAARGGAVLCHIARLSGCLDHCDFPQPPRTTRLRDSMVSSSGHVLDAVALYDRRFC